MHESHTGRDKIVAVSLNTIFLLGIEPPALDIFLRTIHCQVDCNDSHKGFALIPCKALPGDKIDLLEWICKPVIITVEVEVIVLVIELAHLPA